MKVSLLFFSVVLAGTLCAGDVFAQELPQADPNVADSAPQEVQMEGASEGPSLGHVLLLYIPNRILDLIDIFRVKVRVGPGFQAGVRVTEPVSAAAGAYTSIFVGLPGPRQRQLPKLPAGIDMYAGANVSVAEAAVDGGLGPDHSPTEIGVDAQLAIVGFDVGIDPYEIADFFAGLAGVDLREDDF